MVKTAAERRSRRFKIFQKMPRTCSRGCKQHSLLLLGARPAEIVGAIGLRLKRLTPRDGAIEQRLRIGRGIARPSPARKVTAGCDRRCCQGQDRT
jgi:hypothetical protein